MIPWLFTTIYKQQQQNLAKKLKKQIKIKQKIREKNKRGRKVSCGAIVWVLFEYL